jgi:hypothetical protein
MPEPSQCECHCNDTCSSHSFRIHQFGFNVIMHSRLIIASFPLFQSLTVTTHFVADLSASHMKKSDHSSVTLWRSEILALHACSKFFLSVVISVCQQRILTSFSTDLIDWVLRAIGSICVTLDSWPLLAASTRVLWCSCSRIMYSNDLLYQSICERDPSFTRWVKTREWINQSLIGILEIFMLQSTRFSFCSIDSCYIKTERFAALLLQRAEIDHDVMSMTRRHRTRPIRRLWPEDKSQIIYCTSSWGFRLLRQQQFAEQWVQFAAVENASGSFKGWL